LLLAVAVAAGSLALFTSSSANPSNVASAGTLSQDNSKKGAAILFLGGEPFAESTVAGTRSKPCMGIARPERATR